jgi:2-amino-4-hydroxy-6-hydroxymethyldihydropteridine diphosphokinase
MNHAYLLIGGNLGNMSENLRSARGRISDSCGPLLQVSSIYQTAAWGKTDQPDFLNQALQLQTTLEPEALLRTLLRIEIEMGRERLERYGPRFIDIDIIFYDDRIIDTESLTLPHPQLEKRRFVLAPLAEIAGNFRHPLLNKTVNELLEICPDTSPVDKKNGAV